MYAIFVVETKSNNKDSDYIYIKAVAEKWGKGINKMSSVYMDGKTNYCKVEKKINGLCNRYKVAGNDDEIRVFLCIDIDNITNSETAIANRELNRKIQNYCSEKKFELIWFYEDIEEVFWGHKVHQYIGTVPMYTGCSNVITKASMAEYYGAFNVPQ